GSEAEEKHGGQSQSFPVFFASSFEASSARPSGVSQPLRSDIAEPSHFRPRKKPATRTARATTSPKSPARDEERSVIVCIKIGGEARRARPPFGSLDFLEPGTALEEAHDRDSEHNHNAEKRGGGAECGGDFRHVFV